MTIAAILTAIALPAYRAHVLRTHRVEARAALLGLATAQEKFYLECNVYATTLDAAVSACSPATLRFSASSERGGYSLSVTHADASSWIATATTAGASPQLADTACRELQLTSTGARTARRSDGTPNDFECWNR